MLSPKCLVSLTSVWNLALFLFANSLPWCEKATFVTTIDSTEILLHPSKCQRKGEKKERITCPPFSLLTLLLAAWLGHTGLSNLKMLWLKQWNCYHKVFGLKIFLLIWDNVWAENCTARFGERQNPKDKCILSCILVWDMSLKSHCFLMQTKQNPSEFLLRPAISQSPAVQVYCEHIVCNQCYFSYICFYQKQ